MKYEGPVKSSCRDPQLLTKQAFPYIIPSSVSPLKILRLGLNSCLSLWLFVFISELVYIPGLELAHRITSEGK